MYLVFVGVAVENGALAGNANPLDAYASEIAERVESSSVVASVSFYLIM